MTKQTAAVLKGSDPRPQLPLLTSWTVTAGDMSDWTSMTFSDETSGLLSGSVTLNRASRSISQGYISKNNKVKFMFTDADGNQYLAKGTYTPASGNTPAKIINGTYKSLTADKANEERKGPGDYEEDPTWSATAQTGTDPES